MWLLIEVQPFRINLPQKASKAGQVRLYSPLYSLENVEQFAFSASCCVYWRAERVLKPASNNVGKISEVLTYSEEKFNHGEHRGNLVGELTGDGREASWKETVKLERGKCCIVPVRNMEFPQASKIRMTKARPRKTFPFLSRPRHPYPIRISPTAPIPTFKVLWKVLKYAKLSEYHSNSENTHPETIFHYAKAPVWLAHNLPPCCNNISNFM